MKHILWATLIFTLVGCGGGNPPTANTTVAPVSTFPCADTQVMPDGKYRSVVIDIPHDYSSVTANGVIATSFENVKLTIDRAKCVGFNTVVFQTFIPIDATTGLLTSAIGNDLPMDYWKFVDYSKQQGLKVALKMTPSEYQTDNLLHSSAYPGVPVIEMLNSLDQYYKEIAVKAEAHKADIMYIGYFQMGFDTPAYQLTWQSIINNVKLVYSGKTTYATCALCTNNVLWDLVDIISVDFEPTTKPLCSATVLQISAYYQSSINAIKDISQAYRKPIWLDEMDFEVAGCSFDVNTNSYSLIQSGQLSASYAPNYNWQSNNIRAVFEITATSLTDNVSGVVFGTYMPWIQAEWVQHPYGSQGILFNLFDKLGYSLYNNDQAQFTLEEYLGKPWGYHIYY